MPSPQWTYLVADLRTNLIIGDLPLTNPRITKTLNDAGTLTGDTPPASDPRMRKLNLYEMTMPARRAIYALRDSRPWWGGIIWTRKYDSSTGVVSLGCADFWSYFDHRKVIPIITVPPATYTAVAGLTVTYAGVDQNQIARNLVALAQTHTGGSIDIQLDATTSNTPRDRTYLGYELNNLGDMLRQLSKVDGGPDILFEPGTLDSHGRPARLMRLGTPTLGQQGSPYVWEAGGNLVSFVWGSDGTKMATRTFGVGDGIDVDALVAVAEDTGKYADGWPLLESETGYTTVSDTGTLQAHANSDRAVAALPQLLIELTVRGTLPPTVGEYGVGDDARLVIANDPFLPNKVDTTVRITTISINPTEAAELVTLTASPTLEDVA